MERPHLRRPRPDGIHPCCELHPCAVHPCAFHPCPFHPFCELHPASIHSSCELHPCAVHPCCELHPCAIHPSVRPSVRAALPGERTGSRAGECLLAVPSCPVPRSPSPRPRPSGASRPAALPGLAVPSMSQLSRLPRVPCPVAGAVPVSPRSPSCRCVLAVLHPCLGSIPATPPLSSFYLLKQLALLGLSVLSWRRWLSRWSSATSVPKAAAKAAPPV